MASTLHGKFGYCLSLKSNGKAAMSHITTLSHDTELGRWHTPTMPTRSSKRPTDANQLAKLIVDIATGDASEISYDPATGKNLAAVALGRLGGQKGGKARAARLTPEERVSIARNAAAKRWEKKT